MRHLCLVTLLYLGVFFKLEENKNTPYWGVFGLSYFNLHSGVGKKCFDIHPFLFGNIENINNL
jgi:hypothetical protein